MTERPSLVEFLEACIDKDEKEAERARDYAEASMYVDKDLWVVTGMDNAVGVDYDPARVLAECEAKRRIIELHGHPEGSCWEMHRGIYGPGWPEGSYATEGQPWAHPCLEPPEVHPGPCETLQLLALPYASHPDFDPGWAP